MTRDEIIRMAQETEGVMTGHDFPHSDEFIQWCERFAALVSSAERNECGRAASIALLGADKSLADRVVNAIRSRGYE